MIFGRASETTRRNFNAEKKSKINRIVNINPRCERPFFEANGPVLKKHYLLHDQIESAWKLNHRAKIIALCEEQISLSSEVLDLLREEELMNGESLKDIGHAGFERLAMLFEKESNFSEAIRICELGIAIGWSNHSLNHRATRCLKKVSKQHH